MFRGIFHSSLFHELGEINPQTRRVHTSFNQTGSRTGRLASSDPNLQNIPIRTPQGRRIREAFVAPEGSLILACDYSQIELRIMAHLSGDKGLLKAFREGVDVHRATAGEVFGASYDEVDNDQRRAAKAINFGLMYGMSAFGLSKQLHIDRSEAQAYMDTYFDRYPGVRAFMDGTREQAREQGYVETLFGRRLYLPDIKAGNMQRRQGAERAAINAPMQGTAADIIKRAMIRVDAWLQAEQPGLELARRIFWGHALTVTGRLRGHVGYTQRANSPFQGLAADGNKLALFRLLRAGYQVCGFVHDEMLILIPHGADYDRAVQQVQQILADAMQELTPDIPITTEYLLADRWYKDVDQQPRDGQGRILPYKAGKDNTTD